MNRKEMVKRLGEFLGVKPKYLSAPTFAYAIVTEEETYTIDRQGTIRNSNGDAKHYDEIVNLAEPNKNSEAAMLPELDGLEITLPLAGHTGNTLRNLVNMLYSKQHLIMMAFESNEPLMDDTLPKDLSEKETGTLGDFKKALDELGLGKLPNLAFDFENETFTIKLAVQSFDSETVTAFQDLIGFIDRNAKKQKRASFKRSQDENPKYSFRTWLIRLGMNGPEYKTTRKVLLKNLSGSAAYRKVSEPNG
ncbi:virulence-related protein [Bacillus aquiflavi]|uniref:Virulence-related protein n=1 Tax=Bacillus aquiflavi TaxID=2672567 RepID=A0A6B3W004_9BACI|nr:virulence-related protein [Bacillus aquiflavi]MBA4538465.1 virulence-related protein [Bacillus aquiflavi]NEY82828.1 virulence-related protein [Bacillus aquiflavi]UAC48674.1 hypothetical protein K6959_01420 [Bacillus aquiflavi]